MGRKERQIEDEIIHEMASCIHFTGIHRDQCRAGINIRELVGGDDFGWAKGIPCLLMDAETCTVVCESRKLPTREEAEAEVRRSTAVMDRTLNALTKAHEDAKAKGLKAGHGGVSEMPCPAGCGGVLRYSVAGINGHMHASCSSGNCVSWME